ncbi:Gamma-tubulin complex component 4, partial [Cladochytrium tenue]
MLHELLVVLSGCVDGGVLRPVRGRPPPADLDSDADADGGDRAEVTEEDNDDVVLDLEVPADFPFLDASDRAALARLARTGVLVHRTGAAAAALRRRCLSAATTARVVGADTGSGGSYALCVCGAAEAVLEEQRALVVHIETKVLDPLDPDTGGGRVPVAFLVQAFAKYERTLPALLQFLNEVGGARPKYHGLQILDALARKRVTGDVELKQLYERLLQACSAVLVRQLVSWMMHGVVVDPFREFFVAAADGTGSGAATKWDSAYVLVEPMLPRFIPEKVARKVLFVGKAVAAIKQSKRNNGRVLEDFAARNQPVLTAMARGRVFQPLDLEVAVDRIKKDAAAILWDVVVVDEDLPRHLEACRNYFLLGRGDFFALFVDECETLKRTLGLQLLSISEN